MSLVATLISHPNQATLKADLANKASDAIHARQVNWLCEDVACDLELEEAADAQSILAELRDLLASHPIDVAVQDAASRRKKMLIADMDSTMIDQECIDELAEEVGLKAHVAAITARAMNGEIAFEPALRERVGLLKGLNRKVIDSVISNRITLASGGRELVATMNAAGAHTALVSGGFDIFTGAIAAKLGFKEHRANRLVEDGDKLAGLVEEPILGRAAKAQALSEMTQRLGIASQDVIAVGDGANDLDMLQIAGTGVALHAKPSVAEAAPFRIDHGDLTALLYLQGYRRVDFTI